MPQKLSNTAVVKKYGSLMLSNAGGVKHTVTVLTGLNRLGGVLTRLYVGILVK